MKHASEASAPTTTTRTQWPRSVAGLLLVVLGLVGINKALAETYLQRTEANLLITDFQIGLESSPLYVSHEERVLDLDAIPAGQQTRVLTNYNRLGWASWSMLLVASSLAATTLGLLLLIRRPKREGAT